MQMFLIFHLLMKLKFPASSQGSGNVENNPQDIRYHHRMLPQRSFTDDRNNRYYSNIDVNVVLFLSIFLPLLKQVPQYA